MAVRREASPKDLPEDRAELAKTKRSSATRALFPLGLGDISVSRPLGRREHFSMSASDPSIPTKDSDLPDLDTDGARRFLRDPPLSKVSIYRLGRAGEIDGYILCGRRLWRRCGTSCSWRPGCRGRVGCAG